MLKAHRRQWLRLVWLLSNMWHRGTGMYVLALLSLALMCFQIKMPIKSLVQDTLFVIDISESMNVRDVNYASLNSDRLALAKLAVRESMAALPCGSRVSLGLFAGDETIVLFEPLEVCGHYPAIEQVVMRLDTRMRWIGDSWVIRALMMAMQEAEKRNMNLVMITDADEMPHKSAPRFNDLLDVKGKVNGLLLGVGNTTPLPVPKLDGEHRIVAYWTPEEAVLEGNHPNLLAYVKELKPGERAPDGALDEVGEHLSAFNRNLLQTAAQTAHLHFEHIKKPENAVQALKKLPKTTNQHAERDANFIFGLCALFFVLLGWFWDWIYRHSLQKLVTSHVGNKSHSK